mmetsp:Transcript_4527/g.8720  ORF Transcript_4527/g.8720 Transcript_4527/m.8720 type:complete len:763 (+) Transcript_4527:53-2341(+)
MQYHKTMQSFGLYLLLLAIYCNLASSTFIQLQKGSGHIIPLNIRNQRTEQFIPSLKVVTDDTVYIEKQEKRETKELSELDARVLQSLLEDESLDLKSQRKMLKDGVYSSSTVKETRDEEVHSSSFSSTFFKTLDNNELWNSFSAKAESFMESAKLYLQNRIDRDAKLLATIGVFAWQRALKDVERALPSAGKSGAGMAKKMRDSLFLLTNSSSYVSYVPQDNFILSPSKYSLGIEKGVYEELNTPMDEIKSVTESIRKILAGKGFSEKRGLNSVAPAGSAFNAERQKMAFERRKETVLKREKEGIDAKVLRATSTLTDTAWELKREIQVEGNEAGYRAKRAQKKLQGTLSSAGLLGGVKNKPFRGIGERVFGETSKSNPTVEANGDHSKHIGEITMDHLEVESKCLLLTMDHLKAERKRLLQGLRDCIENPGETWLKNHQSKFQTVHVPNDTLFVDNLPYYASPVATSPIITSSNENLWEELITTMVLTRDDIETQLRDTNEYFHNEDDIIEELRKLENTITMICSQAATSAGHDTSHAILTILKGKKDAGEPSILFSLDAILDQRKENKISNHNFDATYSPEVTVITTPDDLRAIYEESSDSFEPVVVTEVLPSDTIMSQVSSNRDYSLSDVEFEILTKLDSTHRSTKSDDLNNVSSVSANVEIVTDDEPIFQDDNGKGMNSAAVDESSTATSNTPVILKFFLRIIDVSLFVMEKSVTNGLPGMFRIYNVMKQRIDASSREGMGKRGWEPLDNLGDASRRY